MGLVRAPSTLDTQTESGAHRSAPGSRDHTLLVLLWSAREPDRIGEVLRLPPGTSSSPHVFGRGGPQADDRYERLVLVRQRPARDEPTEPLENPFLSRQHLKLGRLDDDGLRLERLGKRPLLVNGVEVDEADLHPGDTVEIRNLLLFACTRRFWPQPVSPRDPVAEAHAFGEADANGIVGESPVAWLLRARIAFVGPRRAHVLVYGPSGTGKELVARGIHAASERAGRKLVSRSAATLPGGLIDAELFGNLGNYPNPGMPERQGLIGEADGSTLFLDEIGELPVELQSHLLRVLDSDGEYQRLGEARRRQADLRLVAATNRRPEDLKHDLGARLALSVPVPGLDERLEDVPLIARHLLRRIAARDATIGERFFEGWPRAGAQPRIDLALVHALVHHEYRSHVRELEALLWKSIGSSPGAHLSLTDEVQRALSPRGPLAEGGLPGAEAVRAALAKHAGVRERAWKELGLASRHVLHRLMKKYGIDDEGTGA
jgi:two-component system nitrogen regulation response regulator GlnG/two-component system response regulator HydG